jgi:hypothetical protein
LKLVYKIYVEQAGSVALTGSITRVRFDHANPFAPCIGDLPEDLQPLVRRNSLEVRHSSFQADSERLVTALEQFLEQAAAEQQREREEKERLEAERPETEAKERLGAERRQKEERDLILRSYSLPLSDPKFVFADAKALATFLNEREKTHFEIIKAIGYYKDPGTQQLAGNFYRYESVEIGEDGPAQLLSIFEVDKPWGDFIADKVDRFELQDHSEVILNGYTEEVVLVRALEHPIHGRVGTTWGRLPRGIGRKDAK